MHYSCYFQIVELNAQTLEQLLIHKHYSDLTVFLDGFGEVGLIPTWFITYRIYCKNNNSAGI